MNSGQVKFHEFIMNNVKNGCELQADELLAESFDKQDNRTFDSAYLEAFIPRMMKLIKPESVEQVKNIMMNFKPEE